MKICRNCGQQYPDETKFCVHCGKPLEAVGGGPGPAPGPTPPPPRPTPPPSPRPVPTSQKSGGIFESLRENRIVPYILFALSVYFGWGVSLLLGLVVGIVDVLVTKDGNDKLALVLAGCATAFNLLFYIIL